MPPCVRGSSWSMMPAWRTPPWRTPLCVRVARHTPSPAFPGHYPLSTALPIRPGKILFDPKAPLCYPEELPSSRRHSVLSFLTPPPGRMSRQTATDGVHPGARPRRAAIFAAQPIHGIDRPSTPPVRRHTLGVRHLKAGSRVGASAAMNEGELTDGELTAARWRLSNMTLWPFYSSKGTGWRPPQPTTHSHISLRDLTANRGVG